jgi:hypothetical protein
LDLIFRVPDLPRPLSWYITRYTLQGFALGCRPYFVGRNALPPLSETNVVYRTDPAWGSGKEMAVTPDIVLSRGWGDCNDLVNYEVARANAHGINDSVAIADYLRNGQMHAQVRLANGLIRDVAIERGAPANWPAAYIYDR